MPTTEKHLTIILDGIRVDTVLYSDTAPISEVDIGLSAALSAVHTR